MIKTGDKPLCDIKRGMFGLFFEDINYGLDGGLSAEMIENRGFEFFDCGGSHCNWYKRFDGLYGWRADQLSKIAIGTDKPVSRINPHYMVFTAENAGAYVTNKAYDGIFLKAGMSAKISLYVRTANAPADLKIQIRRSANGPALAETELGIDEENERNGGADNPGSRLGSLKREGWQHVSGRVTAAESISGGVFTIVAERPGIYEIDFVSMIPEDAVLGIFRCDLVQKLKALKPGFVRFPGGCVVEGNNLDNMYKWKLSVGIPENRKSNWNRWAVHQNNGHGPFSHYNQSLAVGYYEYFLLCEYLEARPLPVCNVGMACQYESNQFIEIEDDLFCCFVKDALDLIEFANGRPDTEWGGLRAAMGHPEPFNLELVGIGNEQWDTPESRFFERYEIFEAAIHEQYPDIKLIGSAGPNVTSGHYKDAWSFYREHPGSFAYAVDEHYYVSPEWLIDNNTFYDNYPREIKVFAGEYAAHTGPESKGPERNNMLAAAAEAAFLTGIERNADLVVLASYAPLFARCGYTQWAPDMIWFDAEKSAATPNYYVQQLFMTKTGDREYPVSVEESGVFASVSADTQKKRLFVKLVNTTAADVRTKLNISSLCSETETGIMTILHESAGAYNSVEIPDRVVPATHTLQGTEGGLFDITLPALSVCVAEFECR